MYDPGKEKCILALTLIKAIDKLGGVILPPRSRPACGGPPTHPKKVSFIIVGGRGRTRGGEEWVGVGERNGR